MTLGLAGMNEWVAFVKDSEGNTIALVGHHMPEHSWINLAPPHPATAYATVGSHLDRRFWQNACAFVCRSVPSNAVRRGSTEIIACAPHRVGWDHPKARPAESGRSINTGVTTHVAVKIRLKRFGKIRSPHYRIVVADSRTKRDGRAIEEIGMYHPKNDPSVIEVNSERAQYWLSVGAQPTEAVVALFKRTGDWQKYSGDTSPSGVVPQPEKPNKTETFNAALAEVGQEPRASGRGTAKKAAAKPRSSKSAETAVEGTSEEAQRAADAGVADAESSGS
jgi:small subunit ribosomal protein S16